MSDDRRSDAAGRNRQVGPVISQFDRRWVVGGMITFAASGFLNPVASAAAAAHSLVMIEDDGCVYCVRWHKEVGDAYANSAEGRFAPLDRRRMRDPEIAFLRNIRYTPTFVLLRGDEEIGRITGYPGADFFWQLLADLLTKAGFKDTPALAPVDDIKT
jgi:thioredoxin-related protein